MKKRNLAALAIVGISAGLLAGGCQQTAQKPAQNGKGNGENGKAAEQNSPDMKAFYASLSPEGQKKFDELDAQHKMMAIEMSNQQCNGQNKCAGMGGCASADNACAGHNSCKGHGGAPVKDPNKAVDVQYENQMKENNKAG